MCAKGRYDSVAGRRGEDRVRRFHRFCDAPLLFRDVRPVKSSVGSILRIGAQITGAGSKAILLATAGDDEEWVVGGLAEQFRDVCRWAHWQEAGSGVGFGMP